MFFTPLEGRAAVDLFEATGNGLCVAFAHREGYVVDRLRRVGQHISEVLEFQVGNVLVDALASHGAETALEGPPRHRRDGHQLRHREATADVLVDG